MLTLQNIKDRKNFVTQVIEAYREELEALDILAEVYTRPIYKEIQELEKEQQQVQREVDITAAETKLTQAEKDILHAVRSSSGPVSIAKVAYTANRARSTTSAGLRMLASLGLIRNVGNTTYLPN